MEAASGRFDHLRERSIGLSQVIFAWATTDVMRNDVGWNYTGQWWIWVPA